MFYNNGRLAPCDALEPSNIEAEFAIIGGLILDPGAIPHLTG